MIINNNIEINKFNISRKKIKIDIAYFSLK